MTELYNTIVKEMYAGNFSFAILIIGVLQLIVMIINITLMIISLRKKR